MNTGAILLFLQNPYVENTLGLLTCVFLWWAQAAKSRRMQYLLTGIAAVVTIAYSLALAGWWFILKWVITGGLSFWQFARFKQQGKNLSAARVLKKTCENCTIRG